MSHASLLAAYLAGDAKAFFADDFRDPAARARAVRRATRPLAPRALEVLRAQNEQLAPSAARSRHLDALQHGAAAVVTGQQVGSFWGRCTRSTKRPARSRSAAHGARDRQARRAGVLASDRDHDCRGRELQRATRRPAAAADRAAASSDARVSLAHCALPPEIEQATAVLRAELQRLPHAAEHLERIERAYRAGAKWGDAFAHVVAECSPQGPRADRSARPATRGAGRVGA